MGGVVAGTFGAPVAEGQVLHEQALDVSSGSLWHPEDGLGSGERIELVDPVAYDRVVRSERRVPAALGTADAAATIAQQVIADADFETTGPVSARVGGIEAVSIDVALAPGGKARRSELLTSAAGSTRSGCEIPGGAYVSTSSISRTTCRFRPWRSRS